MTDLLISRENDLRALMVARDNEVLALRYVEPPSDNSEARWKTRSVGRVWLATFGSDEALICEDQFGEFTSRMAVRSAAAYSISHRKIEISTDSA